MLDKYSVGDATAAKRSDIFSQAGFISANVFVDSLLKMDPAKIDRASVTATIRNVKNDRCGQQ